MRPFPAALAALSLAAAPALPWAQEAAASRAQIPDQYKWKLSEMYPSDAAFEQAKEAFGPKIEAFAKRRGRLGQGPKAIADTLTQLGALQNEVQRLGTYAQSRSDEDTREAVPRGMKSEAEALFVKLDAASSWVRPELLALPPARIKAALKAEPRLKDWRFYLQEILRWKPHTLRADEEKLVSMAAELGGAPYNTYSVLANADLPYPTVQLSTGDSIRLDSQGYERGRTSASHADRVKVFQGFFGALKGFERTSGTTLYAALRAHAFEQEARRFGSTLEASLFRDNVPTTVYRQLVKDVNANLGTLHRYLALRQKMMGLDRLGYEDLYPPLVKGMDRQYGIAEAQQMTLAAVAPLGSDYQSKLRGGFESGWTDFLPSTGKRSGAYSTGVYGIHPYQLLNYNGGWDDVSTLAHESGHSMHTLLAFEHQPFATSNYAIFVAEVASTLNESLLFQKALAEAQDRLRAALPAGGAHRAASPHALPPDHVRGVRAGHPRAGREGRGPHRREADRDLPRGRPPLLRPRQGRLQGRPALRGRVGLHPALLLQLSTSTSTPPASSPRPPSPSRSATRRPRGAPPPATATSGCWRPAAPTTRWTCSSAPAST